MKMVLTLLGVVFVVMGLLGFVNDPVLGVFEVDILHNVIHILSGVLALAAVGMGVDMMRLYAKVFGVIYGLVGLVGFVMPGDMILGLFEANLADDLLHVALAAVFLYVGFIMKENDSSMPPQVTM
ncbi:MAG: DUF4383 domain-containing protein [Candidatus Moraniibacteriota bacterium]|nr:MAG: DUF4383 domain-containing protein [Candidatus Moranbacteria bacterium]